MYLPTFLIIGMSQLLCLIYIGLYCYFFCESTLDMDPITGLLGVVHWERMSVTAIIGILNLINFTIYYLLVMKVQKQFI